MVLRMHSSRLNLPMPTISEADKFIVPLLQDAEERPGILGTATFCAVGDHHFLVTAAHVLDGMETIHFGAGVIEGDVSTLVVTTGFPASGNRDDDTIDLAIIRLVGNQRDRLLDQGRRAIPISDWDVDDLPSTGQHYVFTGFPHTGTDRDRARRLIEPRRLSANCITLTDQEILRMGLNSRTHIVGLYDRRRMQIQPGRMVMAPEPYGMSGGPVWTVVPNSDRLKWVGIGIEYRREQRAMVGTRLGAVAALMRAKYPDVAPLLHTTRNCSFMVGGN